MLIRLLASRATRLLAVLLALWLPAPGFVPAAAAQSEHENLVVIRDAETETLLRKFANPLFRAAGLDVNLVRIILIRDAALNSFVSTGNRMFINTGLLMKADSAAEVIGVLAHETGHVAGGHLARMPEAMRAAMIESIAALLIGAAAGVASRDGGGAMAAALGGQQMAMRNLLAFTRGQESAADTIAMRLLDANHWSARGLLSLFGKLEQEEALMPDMQDPYLLTHPLSRDRIDFVRAHVAHSKWSNAPLPAGWDEEFEMVKAKLQGFLDPSSVTLQRVKATDHSAPARYARAIALYRLGHIDEAIALIDGLLKEQPSSPWLWELKGQVLFEGGRGRAALAPYQEAARLAPGQAPIRAGLARAMVETNDPLLLKPAVANLQSALARDDDDIDSWRSLGVAWGRLGDLGQADLALAEETMRSGDIKRARSFAAKAARLLPPGPAKLRAQDISNATKKENRKGF